MSDSIEDCEVSTHDTSDTACKGEEPEQALGATVSSVGGGAEDCTNDDRKSRPDECDLTAIAIADQTNEDLAKDST